MNTASAVELDGDRFVIGNGNILQGYPKQVAGLIDKTSCYERDMMRRAEWELLKDNAFFLFENKDKIFSDSRMFLAPVKFFFGWCSLGSCLEWWMDLGQDALIISFAGSPLSGTCHRTTVTADGKTHKIVDSNFLSIATRHGKFARYYDAVSEKYDAYSLWEVIQRLKGLPPDYSSGFDAYVMQRQIKSLQECIHQLEMTCQEQQKETKKLRSEITRYKDKIEKTEKAAIRPPTLRSCVQPRKIVFGFDLDGAHGCGEKNERNETLGGPLEFLDFLEKRLGIDSKNVPQEERILAYLEKARAVYKTEPDAALAADFRNDCWQMAERLLAWRDELLEAGWDGKSGGSDKLDLLAKIETTGETTVPGIADRIRNVTEMCSTETLGGTRVSFADDPANYPLCWRILFKKLGVKPVQQTSCLSKCSVQTVTASSEEGLAEQFEKELRACAKAKKSIAVIADGDTSVLDNRLRTSGLGTIGQTPKKDVRSAIQILQLWVECMWEPFSVKALMTMLNGKVTPVPLHDIGNKLTEALREEPRIGGDAWNRAWNEVNNDQLHYREILEAERFEPDGEGIPYDQFEKRINWLINELIPKTYCENDTFDVEIKDQIKKAIGNARLLQNYAKSLVRINRSTVNSLLKTIMADFPKETKINKSGISRAVYTNPGQITDDYDVILWWSPTRGNVTSAESVWTEQEQQILGPDADLDGSRKAAREANARNNAHAHVLDKVIEYRIAD